MRLELYPIKDILLKSKLKTKYMLENFGWHNVQDE